MNRPSAGTNHRKPSVSGSAAQLVSAVSLIRAVMSSRASGLTSTMKIHEISALIAASRLAPGSDETYLHVLPRNRAFLTRAAGILLPDPSLEIRCRPSVGDGHRHRRL